MEKHPEAVRILIADDHPIFREGLRKLLEGEQGFRVIGEATNGEEAVKMAHQLRPDLLLLDLFMPSLPGVEVLRELGAMPHQVPTIVLTAAVDKDQIVEAFRLGARGIIMKHSATDLLFKGIRCVLDGHYWIGHEGVSELVRALLEFLPRHGEAADNGGYHLTAREKQVVALIVAGYTNKDIAKKFGISEHTVKHHLTNIFDKLGVSNRLELVLFSIDHRLIDNLHPPLV
jgi:DNA-binding NarL/FixJ family response regulator